MFDPPPDVRAALDRLVADLRAFAPEPYALFVFGSLAKGTFRPGSDVNLGVVLGEPKPSLLRAFSPAMRRARNAVGVRPYVLVRDEIPRLTDVFPVRILDMRAFHHLLHGPDPFAGCVIDREHLRLRAEQELRNHLIRLRHHLLIAGEDALANAKAVAGATAALAVELGALTQAAGHAAPPASVRGTFEAAGQHLDVPLPTLDALATVHEGAEVANAAMLVDELHALLERAVRLADGLEAEGALT